MTLKITFTIKSKVTTLWPPMFSMIFRKVVFLMSYLGVSILLGHPV